MTRLHSLIIITISSLYLLTQSEYNIPMTKSTKIKITGLLILLLFGLSGCTTFNNFKAAFIENTDDNADTISIGVYEPMSGVDKEAAELELNGIELAHKLHPNVKGREVKLIYADNNSDIDAAETAIETLISKNPSMILGSYGNLYSLLASERTEDAKIPAITMTNTNPLVTRNNSYYFRICYIDATQGRLLANYLDSIKVDEVGVLLPENDDAAMAMATAFTNTFEELTGHNDVTGFYEDYKAGVPSFKDQLEILKSSGVKYVLLPGDNADSINIINQAAKMGLDVTFLGDMSWSEEDFHRGLSKQVDPKNLAFVQFFAKDGDDTEEVVSKARQEFLSAYANEYGSELIPEDAVALGYDAYMIALDAIEKATGNQKQVADGTAVRDLLLSDGYIYEGASGTIQFNRYGDPKKTAYISTWDGDKVKAIYTIEASDQ